MPEDAARFELQTQLMHNWCWAAVTLGVHSFFNKQPPHTQFEVASLMFPGNDCRQRPDNCDRPRRLGEVLDAVQREFELVDRPLSFAEVKEQIDLGRPLCARITWPAGLGAHFVVIYGYRDGGPGLFQVKVSDPFFPDSIIDYDEFATAYQGDGTWESSFKLFP